jgi:NADPH-dependent glutamate synthase beta subunit-like oxidoreductase
MKYQYQLAPNVSEYSLFTGLAKEKMDRKAIAKDIPCQHECPANTDVPGYIEEIFKGNHDEAYRINLEDNIFPSVLGRVCTRPCEGSCRHNWTNIEGPVTICHLKRAAADKARDKATPLKPWFGSTGKTVAVIGGGPAGLAAARQLRRFGHQVTIFEREDHLGGMMVDGIPKFRLPRSVVDKEISLIIDSGIEVKLGQDIGAREVQQLKSAYDAVVVAIGTMIARSLTFDGVKSDQLISGLQFMKEYNNGIIREMQGNVVVIGGGFTAIDCSRSSARAAKRLVGEGGKVSIMYRRTEHHMAAELEELEEIRFENIEVRTLVSPKDIVTENGKITGVRFSRNKVGEKGPDGKPQITPIEGSDFVEPADHVIIAIGQQQDWSVLPEGVELQAEQRTSDEQIFATGDFFMGSKDVINAVADGKRTAEAVDRYLTGQTRYKKFVQIEELDIDGETGRQRDHDLTSPNAMPLRTLVERAVNDAEVETGYGEEEAIENAGRCYFCHYKFEIDQDKCIHCDWCIEVAPRDCIKRVSRVFKDGDGALKSYVEAELAGQATYIFMDSDACIRCGKCIRVCPTGAISMRKTTLTACTPEEHNGQETWVPLASK